MTRNKTAVLAALLSLAAVTPLGARAQQWPNPYGLSIGIDAARKVATAAVAEAKKNGWNMAVAVVDTSGTLVFFEKMDQTQLASVQIAQDKARTAALYRRPSKALEDAVVSGKVNYLNLPGALPIEGGLPIVMEGKIVGAIGASGGSSAQDGICAKAGAEAAGPQPGGPAAK
jgi:uncharacterized protein GlcG (DUF336 family)